MLLVLQTVLVNTMKEDVEKLRNRLYGTYTSLFLYFYV